TGLPCARAGASDGGVLLEQPQQERALRPELAIDRALREACRLCDLFEGRELDPALSEHTQPGLDEQHAGLRFSPLSHDTHEHPRYLSVSKAQRASLCAPALTGVGLGVGFEIQPRVRT